MVACSGAELLAKVIPKPKGGIRPMMWYRSLYRVFARARRVKVQEVFNRWAPERPEVHVAPGRHTTDAVWKPLVRQGIGGGSARYRRW